MTEEITETTETVVEQENNIKKDFMNNLKEEMRILNAEENQNVKIEFDELYKENLEKYGKEEQEEIKAFLKQQGNGDIKKGVEEIEKMLTTEIAIENGALWEYDSNNKKILKNSEPYTQEDKENARKNMNQTEKKTKTSKSKNNKEPLEQGKTYLTTFSWTDKNGEKQEIKACYEIGLNKKGKEAIIFKNNKTFPYSDSTLAPGDENIQNNIKAAKISQFPKDVLSSPKLLEVWNKRLETLGLEKFPEETKDFTVETKDVTRELEKAEKKELKEAEIKTKVKKETEEAYEKPVISEIPEKLKQFYEAKGEPLTEDKYTKKLFNMTKELYGLPEAEKNITDFDKKFFKNLNNEYSKTDGSKEQLEKAFDKYIANPKNRKDINGMGITLEKHETMEQPLKRQIPDEVRYDMNMALDAIKKNKHPLQMTGIPPLIFNPEENKAYRGNAQLSLATNNLLSGTDEKAYVTMSQANQAGAQALKNYKASTILVAHGQDSRGNYVYQLMVPCKTLAAKNAEKKLAQIEKDNRKINYEMVKAANKFYKKHGFLPQYDIELVNKPQEPLASIKDISIPKERGETPKERITNDLNKYMAAAITQTEFKPSVDYTKEPHKTELFEFQQSNPGMMIMLANKAYYNIANQTVQANTQERTNVNTNTNNEVQTENRVQKLKNTNNTSKGRRR